MKHGRVALTLLTAALVAGPVLAEERTPAAGLMQASRARALELRQNLGLDSQHDFAVRRGHTDELGQTHTRMNQLFNGVRVWGGELITHVDADGSERPMTAELRRNIAISVKPTLGANEVLGLVHTDLNPRGTYASAPTSELVIYPQMVEVARRISGRDLRADEVTRQVLRYRLAYHVHTELENGADETAHTDYIVDAHTGAILNKWSTLHTSDAVGTANTQFSGTVSIHTNYTGSTYELNDVYRGMNIKTYDLAHGTGSGTGTLYTDADNTWGNGTNYTGSSTSTTSATGQTAAVDAHYGIEMTYDFYKNVLGRNGIDGNNKATYSRVHYSTSYDNAFWSDTCFCMTYGDGSSFKSLEALDVAGHEMSHGVCASTANLTYSGESGGLNEANSDMFGNMVELYAKNNFSLPATVANTDGCWTVGEQLSSTPLRYMYKPSLDGSSPNAWSSTVGNLDVHYSSGPANRMFFFLSQGASATSSSNYYSSYTPNGFTGIGPEKAIKIWYRALTTYFTSSTNYASARTGAISAAKDLYGAGGAEEQAVWNAFAAINVGSAWTQVTETTPTISTQPASVSVGTGATATFTVVAAGGNLKYQWYKNSAAISGATSASYTTPATTSSDNGATFYVVVSNTKGSVTSSSATLTVTTAPPSTDLILNGGFESGSTNWTGTTAAIGTFSGEPAYAGTKCAWLGGNGTTTTETLYQAVTIPSTVTSATLSFYLHIDTAETTTSTAYDKLAVSLQNTSGTTLKTLATYSNLNKAAGYVLRTFDVSAYKGQTIRVYFKMTEDSSLQTSFVVDNVSLTTK
jgi:Zn-dependent metalloprotease